ncbi:energy transducer TonB [Seonamhaeicola sp.]|uniref:energy transducer TonB n=1 Tax=Seonamhaeicola sp. TaxID=1912245 RepID=UPI00260C632B|nr:energy transducer TonB [Seonamhaeicola sp.]
MKKYYSIKIPEPCHEDWRTMTPKEKGRYCDSCAKTVIDFTKMSTFEIQDFIHQNKGTRICGHFKQTQLDSVNIHIPSQVLEKQHSFHKLFLLVLLIAMGTSLMNCSGKNGNKQKIDSIEVIDSIDKKTIDVLGNLPKVEQIDSLLKKDCNPISKKDEIIEVPIDGELVIETVGDIDYKENPTSKIDSITTIEPPTVEGEVVIGFIVADPPEFKDTPKNLSVQKKKDYFQERVSKFVSENFNKNVCLELDGKQKIITQFKIDTTGQVVEIKARAPHPALEKEAKRVINLLPLFIPAKQRGKPTKMVYSLPIVFQAEE